MDEHSRRNSIWEAVTGQGNDSPLRIIVVEWRMPEGDGRMAKLGFECGSLTIECMDKEWPRYHVNFYTMWVNLYSPSNLAFPKMISNHSNLSKVSLHSTCT